MDLPAWVCPCGHVLGYVRRFTSGRRPRVYLRGPGGPFIHYAEGVVVSKCRVCGDCNIFDSDRFASDGKDVL